MRTLLIAVATMAATAPALAQTQAAPTCDAPEHRALDFWIGEWNAYRADTDTLAGHSVIRAEDAGCVITEHWTSATVAYSGRSLNIYDRVDGRWEQYWVDSYGNRTHFLGGPTADGMQLTTAAPVAVPGRSPQYMRVTLTRREDGAVLQHGESSPDGREWTTQYAFVYRRAPD